LQRSPIDPTGETPAPPSAISRRSIDPAGDPPAKPSGCPPSAISRPSIERTLRWLFWFSGVAAFVAVLARSDLRGALPAIVAAGPILLVGLVPFLLQIALDALAWRTLLGALDRRVAWRRLIEIRLSTEAVLQSMPGGSLIGESLKPYLLHRATAMPYADTIASIAIKRSLLALAQAGYLSTALLVAHDLYSRHSQAIVGTEGLAWYVFAAVALLTIVAIALGLTLLSVSVADRVHRLLARLPSQRLRAGLESRRAGFAATDAAFAALGRRPVHLGVAWLLLLGAWLIETIETYLLCRLVGLDLDVAHVIAMEAAVVFARNVAFFVPAGLGVQDAGYLAFLSAFSCPSSLSAAFIVVKRTKELIWIAIGYLVLVLLERKQRDSSSTARVVPPLGIKLGGLP
jgi:glycosyltransferase 2 family protein